MTTPTESSLPAGVGPASVGPAGPISVTHGVILREIARGGLTGIIVGLVGGGIGGRIVMRLAAIVVPGSEGAITENGNRIGDITAGGTVALLVFGMFIGGGVATIWVVVSPWIPGAGLRRAVLTMPIAVALGAPALIVGSNPDFAVLGHDPVVVAILVGLIGLIGLLFALVDDTLERRLPAAVGPALTAYGTIVIVGVAFALGILFSFLTDWRFIVQLMGLVLIGLGLATILDWVQRLKGRPRPSWLTNAGRIGLGVAVVVGAARSLPEIVHALGGR